MGFNICLDMMKVVALLLFAASASAEWTCDDCKAAAAALGTYTTSADALAQESDILVAELCPQADDPDTCVKELPGLWAAMAPYIFPEHYKHICEDMECPDKRPIFLAVKNAVLGSTTLLTTLPTTMLLR